MSGRTAHFPRRVKTHAEVTCGSCTEPAPLLISVEDAAAALNISRTATYGLLAAGQLRGLKIGRVRRIALADLHAFVENLRATK